MFAVYGLATRPQARQVVVSHEVPRRADLVIKEILQVLEAEPDLDRGDPLDEKDV